MSDREPPSKPPSEAPAETPTEPTASVPSAEEEAAKKAEAAAKAKAAAEAKAVAVAKKAAIEAAKPPWERDAVTPTWEEAGEDPLAVAMATKFGEAILSARSYAGDLTLEVELGSIAKVAAEFKARHGFTFLVDLCGADYPDREKRFDVVYQLHSFTSGRRIRLRVTTDEETPVPTVCEVWKAANWCEREVYDMYGVRFEGHPDMTRILLWEGFNGHPLRKDFPVEGIDTGAAIYPEYYEDEAGPITGTGTGWMQPKPPVEADEEAGE